jgi:choline dehydrogenase-like flavoprotein
MQVTYLAKAAKLGVQIIENQKVTCVIPTTQSLTVSAVSAIGEETFYQGNEVVLAAGTIGTPTILHKSRLSRGNFDLNFHPMLRAVSRQDELINTGDLFPSWQAWTPDLRLKYGYSVSSYPFLSATLSSLGEGKRFSEAELSTMAAYFGSFALSDSKVHLRTFRKNLVPVIHWGRIDKKSLIEVSIQLRKLLESGDSIEFWPKTGLSPITTVHLFGSIPISRSSLVDSRGRLISDSRIRVSDASIMPYATWGNPQGAIMVMCELMAQRWERGE